jgi:hypothetical protein
LGARRVITELLHHAEDEVDGEGPLLKCVNGANTTLQRVHVLLLIVGHLKRTCHCYFLPKSMPSHLPECNVCSRERRAGSFSTTPDRDEGDYMTRLASRVIWPWTDQLKDAELK